ncbi:MAG: hypothetical protein ACK55O_15825 [Phycisphaerales bacterium]
MVKRYEAAMTRAISEIDYGLLAHRMMRERWCSVSQATVVMYHSGGVRGSTIDYDAMLILRPRHVNLSCRVHLTPRDEDVLAALIASMRSVGIEDPVEEE